MLDLLGDRKLDLPVFFDWERISGDTARTDGLDNETLTACAVRFCQTIESAGFDAGVYIYNDTGYYGYDLAQLEDYTFWCVGISTLSVLFMPMSSGSNASWHGPRHKRRLRPEYAVRKIRGNRNRISGLRSVCLRNPAAETGFLVHLTGELEKPRDKKLLPFPSGQFFQIHGSKLKFTQFVTWAKPLYCV